MNGSKQGSGESEENRIKGTYFSVNFPLTCWNSTGRVLLFSFYHGAACNEVPKSMAVVTLSLVSFGYCCGDGTGGLSETDKNMVW